MTNTITFDPIDMEISFSVCEYILGVKIRFVYEGHPIKVKGTVTENEKSVLAQCKTLVSNNSSSIKDKAMKLQCSI